MPKAKKKKTKKRTGKKPTTPHVYRMPKTAAELNIVCSICAAPAEYFDAARARGNHMNGFICANEPRGPGSEKLLIRTEG